jgi:hypothetical protein
MRVLLNECVPHKFKYKLSGHDCRTVPEAGFAGKKNGELLVLAEEQGFEIFLTLDKGVAYQQAWVDVISRSSSSGRSRIDSKTFSRTPRGV